MAVRVTPVGPLIQANNESAEGVREQVYILTSGNPGIFAPSDLAVSQHAGTPAMNVDVAAGRCSILGTSSTFQGMYHFSNDAVTTLTIATAPGSNQRVDIVCASIQDAAYAGGSNTGLLQVVTGTSGASPAVPATPASSIVLAHVFVGTSVTSILNANINGTTGTNNPDAIAYVVQAGDEGRLATQGSSAGGSGAISSAGAPGTAIGRSVTVNVGTSRRIRILAQGTAVLSSASGVGTVGLYRDGTSGGGTNLFLGQQNFGNGTAGASWPWSLALEDPAPTAGIHTYFLQGWCAGAGTVTFNAGFSGATLMVDDYGPQ